MDWNRDMMEDRTRLIFRAMVREEWRLHSQLFSGRRFSLFPVFIFLLVAGAGQLLVVTGRGIETIVAGVHALVFVFGLHTGSIGLVGRDAVRNLLGDVTLLVFSARTLPLSRGRLFGVFIVKDVVYYAFLFLLPISVGLVPALWQTQAGGLVSLFGAVLSLWLTLIGTFVLGIGITIATLGVVGRGREWSLLVLAVAAGLAIAWAAGLEILAYTPYGVFVYGTLPTLVGAGLALVLVFAVAALTFDFSGHRTVRSVRPRFGRWLSRLGDPVATKTLLDVHRSSGGFGKVIFSGAILFGVTAALVDFAGEITGVQPSVGISFGAILGLTAFTTYNWLTQFDDVDDYLHHPITVPQIFRAKFRAFLILGPAVGLGFYLLAVLWLGSPTIVAIVGAVLLVGVAIYIFGVTVALTGLSPNEFLFDTLLFAVFGVAVMVPLVPILVVGFALAPVDVSLLVVLGVGGLLLGVFGVVLYQRSLPKWTRHHGT